MAIDRSSKKCSKELLGLENDDVSTEVHVARLLTGNHSAVGSGRPGKILKLPPSAVLNRVANFLPKLQEANEKTRAAAESGENIDIESVDGVSRVVEMNLAILEQDGVSDDSVDSSEYSSSNASSDEEPDQRPNCKRRLIIETSGNED